jgi:hypothetical protein
MPAVCVCLAAWSVALGFNGEPILGPVAALLNVQFAVILLRTSALSRGLDPDAAAQWRVQAILAELCFRAGCAVALVTVTRGGVPCLTTVLRSPNRAPAGVSVSAWCFRRRRSVSDFLRGLVPADALTDAAPHPPGHGLGASSTARRMVAICASTLKEAAGSDDSAHSSPSFPRFCSVVWQKPQPPPSTLRRRGRLPPDPWAGGESGSWASKGSEVG